jgi:hypothetical protein
MTLAIHFGARMFPLRDAVATSAELKAEANRAAVFCSASRRVNLRYVTTCAAALENMQAATLPIVRIASI